MAVEIPVVVNIADGIDDAIKNQLPKAMRNAQVAMSKNSLGLKFHIDDSNLAKVETILMDTTLKANQLARALQEVNAEISKKKAGGAKFTGNNVSIKNRALLEAQTALQMKYDALAWAEQYASKEANNLADSQDRVDKSNKKVSSSTQEVNKNLKNTSNHIANLIKNSIRLIAIHAATRFIRNVREVTAEFEMQRVALAGIIQDTAEAESLFKKLKAAAIQSPFEIKDLVTFTKQLSAYRIETDKLYDVTMRLADISAGLGVDMSRLVLAYGQVRAASVLRGQELRQFTEAGIPLVELLAEKFRELGQEGTTTADVFELISKRAVPFKMIEEIFQDMTSAGGAFYKMQEKQSETLKGQWMKLKDAASIMYDEIGNTEVVHNAMESMLSDAMTLLQSWRKLSGVVGGLGAAFAINQLLSLIPGFTQKTTLAKKAVDGLATSLKSVGTWVGLAVTAISAIIGYVIQLRKEANRLNNEIEAAKVKGDIQIEQSLRNFRRLADAAVSAAHGSAEQRDALKELQRTYGDIIPAQDLEIEKLRELQGNYESLTRAISEKIQMQVHEQNLNQIQDTYGNQIASIQKNIKKALIDDAGLSREEAGRYISAVMEAIRSGLIGPLDDATDIFVKMRKIAAEQIGPEKDWQAAAALTDSANFWGKTYFPKLLDVVHKMNDALEDENSYFKSLNNSLGKYSDMVKELRKNAQRVPEGFTLEQTGTFEYNQALWRQRLNDYKDALVKMFGDTDISDAFETAGTINFQKIIEKISSEKGTSTLKAAVNELQKDYLNFAPQEKTTRLVTEAALGFADAVGIAMTKVQGYLKKDGQKMDEYAKSVEDFVNAQKLRVQTKEFEYKNWSPQADWVRPTEEDIQNEKDELDFLEKLLAFVQEFLKQKNNGGSGRDPWIILYKNRMKFMQDFQKGVEDLDKYMAHSASLGREQDIMKGRGLSLGIDTEQLQGDAKELRKWYSDAIDDVVKKIQSLGGKQFAGLGVTEILAKDLTGRKIQKYQELLQELWKGLTDFDTNQLKKDIDDELKRLKDEIKHGETAKRFFDDIFEMTGDKELAARLSINLYGDTGKELEDNIKKSLAKSFVVDSAKLPEGAVLPDINAAIQSKDTKTLRKYLQYVVDDNKSAAEEIISNWEKAEEDWVKSLYKTYEKAKTYEQRRQLISDREAATRERIAKDTTLTPQQKAEMTQASIKKEKQDKAVIDVEELKNTYEWTKTFEDLDRVGNKTLASLVDKIQEIIDKEGHLMKPEELKAMVSALEQVRTTQAKRDPIQGITSGVETQRMAKMGMAAKATGIPVFIAAAKKAIDAFNKSGKATVKLDWDHLEDSFRDANKQIEISIQGLSDYIDTWGQLANGLKTVRDYMADVFDVEEIPVVDEVLEGISGTLSFVAGILPVIITLNAVLNSTLMANPFIAMAAAIIATIGAVVGLIKGIVNAKVEKLNKKIEEQTKLLEQLEYSYDRLDAAMEKAFGSEYIQAYNQQLKILEAEVEAYREQANLEREKGKKTDQEKVDEFEKNAREVEDKIAEMEHQVSEFLTETDVTSAAKDFAQAWIDAYKEFGNTTDAIGQKFKDMIESMVVNSMAARLVQTQLEDIFDKIDTLAKEGGELSVLDAALIAQEAERATGSINTGLTNLMSALTGAGINIRQMGTGLTGISRDIQGASEESILGLAAGVNTQNYFMSQINANVIRIVSILGGTGAPRAASKTSPASGMSAYQTEALSNLGHLPQMQSDMAEVRRLLSEVIRVKGASSTYSVRIS